MVFNAANEIAVASFLREKIPFPEILGCIERTLDAQPIRSNPTLDEIFAADAAAREEATRQLEANRAHSQ